MAQKDPKEEERKSGEPQLAEDAEGVPGYGG